MGNDGARQEDRRRDRQRRAVQGDPATDPTISAERTCPDCGEPINNLRVTCPRCGRRYSEDDYDDPSAGDRFRTGSAPEAERGPGAAGGDRGP